MYYLLFTLEQLGLNPESLKLRLIGEPEEGDPIYELASQYLENVSVFVPGDSLFPVSPEDESIDFTLIGAL